MFSGCGKETLKVNKKDSKTVAITAGDYPIMLDEAKYYAFNSQAI